MSSADDKKDLATLLEEGGDLVSPPTDLEAITEMANEVESIQETIATLEEALKAHRTKLHELTLKKLPDAMAEIGQTKFSLENGTEFKLEDIVSGTVPKDPTKRIIALEHVKELGAEGIIKDTMTVAFNKEDHNMAGVIADDLRSQGYNVELVSSIAPQTYLKFARDALKDGENIDLEKLGLFSGRRVKIKKAKS